MIPAIATIVEGATAIGAGVALTATGIATGTLQVIGGVVVVTEVGRFIKRKYDERKAESTPVAKKPRGATKNTSAASKKAAKATTNKAIAKHVNTKNATRKTKAA